MSEPTALIPLERNYNKLFSICSIVNNWEEYALMKNSFINCRFNTNCEYLVADNADKNNFDAYKAIKRFLQDAVGKYIILVHQDVRCIDSVDKLTDSLDHLQAMDSRWAVCGNAGAIGYHKTFFNLENNGKIKKSNHLPQRVSSLDENLLIIKNDCHLSVSNDINGFHFYGTDLCLIADLLGYNCYVIDFMVNHLSLGNLEQMALHQPGFVAKYGHKFRHRFIQTSCTKFYLSDSESKNSFYNSPFVFFWVKAAQRLSGLFKK